MTFFFNTIYLLALIISMPLVIVFRCWQGKRMSSWPAKFFGSPTRPSSANDPSSTSGRRFWFHAVSVGEVNLVATLVDELRRRDPQASVFVSTSTDTGFALAVKRFGDNAVFFFPWDFSWSVKRTLRRIRPDLIVLAELEVWPNLLRIADRHSIPVAVANGRLSERSFRGYRRLGPLTRSIFSKISMVTAQNETYATRFVELGVAQNRVHVTGSVKFDGANSQPDSEPVRRLARLANIKKDQVIWLAGSTQAGEDEIVLQAFKQLRNRHDRLRLIIAPRHPHRSKQIGNLVREQDCNPIMRSQLPCDWFAEFTAKDVVIIDGIGELTHWWGVSQIAFVGGSLGSRGGQNMIEPAAQKNAVCFGPNTANFRDVVDLFRQHQAAVVVKNCDEMTAFVDWAIRQQSECEAMVARGVELVARQRGATLATLDSLIQLLPNLDSVKTALKRAA